MSADNSRSSVEVRDNKGRFAPGNPGRPVGAKNKAAAGALTELRGMTLDAVEVVRKAIAGGDVKTATWLLERILPNTRTVELEGAGVDHIINALISGDISPAEAKIIAHSIGRLKEIDQLDEVKARMAEIEKLLKGE